MIVSTQDKMQASKPGDQISASDQATIDAAKVVLADRLKP